jgi:hypothetical protein
MQISSLAIHNFEGIQHMQLDFDKPCALISGDNNSGKTSLRDAIHFLVTGESGRVKLKRDYKELMFNGAKPKDAEVTAVIDGAEYGRKIATGKATVEMPDFPILFPFMTGFINLADLTVPDLQKLLAKVTGVKPTKLIVTDMMQQAGVSDECIAAALPMLSAGFPAAHKSAKSRISKAKHGWEALTGERYGSAKAETWSYTAPEAPEGESTKELIALIKKTEKARDKAADRFAGMRTEYGVTQPCPECGVKLNYNSSSGLTVAGNATDPKEYTKTERQLHELTAKVQALSVKLAAAERDNEDADEKTEEAKRIHNGIKQWAVLESALSPEGIPLKLTAQAREPINKRLRETAEITGWPQVMICNDLTVEYGGRNYGLLSESEAWRVNAILAETLSFVGNVGFFILDRMDVLSPKNRGILLKWLSKVHGDHETIILTSTLKAKPAKLPPAFSNIWIEDGGIAA